MNDPNSKYECQNDTLKESSVKPPLQFFNPHEFMVTNENPILPKENEAKLVINHFPNIYEPRDSLAYATTRIIRIPRIYSTVRDSDFIPQFLTYVPGSEPAAISNEDITVFEAKGRYDDAEFGYTSLTPLVPGLISETEFETIVKTINQHLYDSLNPYNGHLFIENVLEFLTGGVYSKVINKYLFTGYSKRRLQDLEAYIEHLNTEVFKGRDGLKIINPRLSGFLSVC